MSQQVFAQSPIEPPTTPSKNESPENPTKGANALSEDLLYVHTENALYTLEFGNSSASDQQFVGNFGITLVTDIAFVGSELYGITFTHLLNINPITGEATQIGPTGYLSMNALAASPDGSLYAADTDGNFILINKTSGAGTLRGNMDSGWYSSGDLAYFEGDMYITAHSNIYPTDYLAKFNISTGGFTTVGDMGSSRFMGMAVKDGILYGLREDGNLFSINTTTGQVNWVGRCVYVFSYWGMTSFVSTSPAPPHDDFDFAYLLPEPPTNGLANQLLDTDTTGATIAFDDPEPGCGSGVNSNTLWYKIIPTHYGSLRVRTFNELDPSANSNYDTVLAVYTGQRGELNLLTCHDDILDSALSEVLFDVEPGITYYVEVADYDESPGGGMLSLFYNYMETNKAWTLMYYTAADDTDDGFVNMLRKEANYLVENAEVSNNPDVNIVGLFEDNEEGSGLYYHLSSEGVQDYPQGELNTGHPNTLHDFLSWAKINFPANNYALIITGHGHGVSGTAIDSSNGQWWNADYLEIRELQLSLLFSDSPHIDVLFMNSCLMGTIEAGYQLRGLVDYYVASESWGWVPTYHEWYIAGHDGIPGINMDTSDYDLAISIAMNFEMQYGLDEEGGDTNSPGTISVVDLNYVDQVVEYSSSLAGLLKEDIESKKLILDGIIKDVQHFAENDDFIISESDELIDLYDFAWLVETRFDNSAIELAAGNLMSAIDDYVKLPLSWNGTIKEPITGWSHYWNHENSNGVSIFFPNTLTKSCYYNGSWLDFANGTDWICSLLKVEGNNMPSDIPEFEWGSMLVEYTQAMNPNAGENYDPPELVAPFVPTSSLVYLPLIIKANHSEPVELTIYSDNDDVEIVKLNCSSWDSCRNASTGDSAWDNLANGTISAAYASSLYHIKRLFLFFDTSSIPSNAVIQNATLSIYADQYQTGDTSFHVVQSTSYQPPTAVDYNNLGIISGGSDEATPNTWLHIDLNVNALNWIAKGGVTKMALIHERDFYNEIPTQNNGTLVALSEYADYKPYLTVTYVIP